MRVTQFAIGLAILLSAASPVLAADSCSCRNLESLQQEVENAAYDAGFFDGLSARLREIETKQIEVNKDPTNKDSGLLVLKVSADARDAIMKAEFKRPHPAVTGYTGPGSVEMEAGKCTQSQPALDAMRDGSPCKEIADITLQHEAAHRKICETMTAQKYWARLPSEIAAEEAERYKAQADAMRGQLKRVIDEGTITVEAIMEPRLKGPQFDVTYSYVMPKIELQGKSSPASDSWTLDGKGSQAGTIKKMNIAGMSCKSSGQINDDIKLSMDTDGFKMSLTTTSVSTAGDLYVKCKGGYGMSMRPKGETGSGSAFAGEKLAILSEFVTDVREMEFAKLIQQGGMSVSGTLKTTVTMVCPGN